MAGRMYWKLLGEMVETGTSFASVAGAAAPSPYIPVADGTLMGLRIMVARQAATSLTNAFQIKLTCATFGPVQSIDIVGVGVGLATVPAAEPFAFDFQINQPIKAGIPITIEGRNTYANSVTPDNLIMGLISE